MTIKRINMKRVLPVLLAVCFFTIACNNNKTADTQDNNKKDSSTTNTQVPDRNGFADSIDGKKTDLYVLRNSNGMTLAITNYGGRFVSLLVPDKEGKMRDVVVGFKSV